MKMYYQNTEKKFIQGFCFRGLQVRFSIGLGLIFQMNIIPNKR